MGSKENLKRGVIDIMILTLLKKEDMYGYQICQELSEQSQGLFVLPEGSLYPTLYRLLDKKYITDRSEKVGKRRTRIYYQLTEDGEKHLETITREYLEMTQGVMYVLKKEINVLDETKPNN